MNVNQRWKLLSARIEGFVDGVSMWGSFDSALANGSQGKQLYRIAQAIFRSLEADALDKNPAIPPVLLSSEIFQRLKQLLSPPESSVSASVQGFVGEAAILLKALVTEVNYVLGDEEAVIRTLSERAFLHLQWTIVADPQTRSKWQAAYDAGEVESEKLGGAHLLWHGIYPFKVSNRVATDLVLEEPVTAEQVGIARGAVLTEWKVVRAGDDVVAKADSAEIQAEEYSAGVLGGTELRSVRFVVLVSRNRLKMPPDKIRGGSTYRHINVAVDPETPSKVAPKLAIAERSGGAV